MPSLVKVPGAATPTIAVAEAAAVLELVPRNCTLQEYEKVAIPAIEVAEEIVAYASPDSTFAVTKHFIDLAKKSILIGIYDLSADHVKQLLLNAMRRGVSLELMLDVDNDKERALFDELATFGADCVEAPSCASERVSYFSSSHEKVIVIDREWTLVQSGNYSNNSIPLNVVDGGDKDDFVTGNRDTGLAIKSKKLATFFADILKSDMDLERQGPQAAARRRQADEPFLVEAAPTKIPDKLFKSKRVSLTKKLSIQPVLSPDNYMRVMPDMLRQATKSILIQQQYIRAKQDKIKDLLAAIKEALDNNPDLDVRILLGKLFNAKELPKEKENLKLLKAEYGLKLGTNIRYVDTSRFVHCHNKMVLIDSDGVLVSSQNWSMSAVWKNREAGIWLEHGPLSTYFKAIFENDWKTAFKKPDAKGKPEIAPEELRKGNFVKVDAADYQEV